MTQTSEVKSVLSQLAFLSDAGYPQTIADSGVDKENYFGAGELDLYNPAGDLFKTQIVLLYPAAIPETRGDVVELLSGPNVGFLVNFTNKHVTVSPGLKPCINSACAKDGYLDIRRYARPEALMKIVQ